MFKKLVSEAPLNPNVINQIRFYSVRLHQEESLRRLGLIFTVLAIGVQMLAVFAPAKQTNAASLNNLIYGASNKQMVIDALKSGKDSKGRNDIKEIFAYYGITLTDVEKSASTTVKSRERSYVTTGRAHSSGLDTAVSIPGTSTTIYERSLNVWDIINYENCYNAITGKATGTGELRDKTFWILLGNCGTTTGGCGNITFETPPKQPSPEIIKKASGSGTFRPNDKLTYIINYRNKGQAAMNNVVVSDTLVSEYEYISYASSSTLTFSRNGQTLKWSMPILQPSQTWHEIKVELKVKAIQDPKKVICNAVDMTSTNSVKVSSTNSEAERCVEIDNTCPGTNLPIPDGGIEKCIVTCPDGSTVTYDNPNNCPDPVVICKYLKVTDRPSWKERKYEIDMYVARFGELLELKLLVNDKEVKNFGKVTKAEKYSYVHDFKNSGTYTVRVAGTPKQGTSFNVGGSCLLKETILQPTAIISLKKNVSNVTQKIDDANNKTAKGGDDLEYTLTISNSGTTSAENYVIDSDNLNDVLEYADLASYNEAIYDKVNQRLTWPAATIPAGGSIIKKFTVKVKNPIPTTPPALSDATSYDYKMRNVFGNEVIINLNKPAAGIAYQTINQLPDTGPGSSLLISSLAFMIIGYFYARNKLLIKEIDIVKNEVITGA